MKKIIDSFFNVKYIVKYNIKKFVLLILSFFVIQFVAISFILYAYAENIDNQINLNISEYDEIDRTQLCKISLCKYAIYDDTVYKLEEDNMLRKAKTLKYNYLIKDFNNISLTTSFDIIINNKMSGTDFVIDTSDLYSTLFEAVLIISLLLFFMSLIFLILSIQEERELSLKALAGNEALLANKSMILITENIHHELNTPMEVIDNKIYKLEKLIFDNDKCDYNTEELLELKNDFNYIKQSSEAIYNVLNRMKGFKNLRYSNGNKSIENIVEGAFKVMSISNSNFSYNIDDELKKYTLNSQDFQNADLLNILINHFKNSLEANANKIYVIFIIYENHFLKIRIIDNGNGIPKNKQADIFNPNFSTKMIGDSGIRGNGLYLNRSILKTCNGNDILIDSTEYGTTFELSLPAKRIIQEQK